MKNLMREVPEPFVDDKDTTANLSELPIAFYNFI